MAHERTSRFLHLVLLFGVVVFAPPAANADTIGVSWIGGTGNWSVASNWSPAVVPNNGGGTTYAVRIFHWSYDVAVNGAFSIDSINSYGYLNISPSGSLSLVRGESFSRGPLQNDGTLNNSGSYVELNNSGVISNNGTLNNSGSAELINTGTIDNAGLINNWATISNAGTLTISTSGLLSSVGTVSNDLRLFIDGILTNGGGMTNDGWLDIRLGGSLANAGSLSSAGSIDNAGMLTNVGSLSTGRLYNSATGTISNAGFIRVDSLHNSGVLQNNDTLDTEGELNNTGTLTNHGHFSHSYGDFDNWGTFTNYRYFDNASRVFNWGTIDNRDSFTNSVWMSSAGTLDNSGRFLNYGDLLSSDIANTGTIYNIGTLTNSGMLTNAGTIDIGRHMHGAGTLTNIGTLTNAGTLSISGTLGNSGTFTNSGDVTISSLGLFSTSTNYTQMAGSTLVNGTLTATGGAIVDILGGTLGGSGTINGDVLMAGVLNPGSSPGTLTINGDYTQTAGGVFSAEVGGLVPGTQYDQLVVNGNVTLDGLLQLMFINQFLPQLGNSFTLLTFSGTRTGTFSSFQWTGLPVGYDFLLNYGQHDVWVAVDQIPGDGPVPEPSSLLLFGTGLLGLASWARARLRR